MIHLTHPDDYIAVKVIGSTIDCCILAGTTNTSIRPGTIYEAPSARETAQSVRTFATGSTPVILFRGPQTFGASVRPNSFVGYNKGSQPVTMEFFLHAGAEPGAPDILIARQIVTPGESLTWLSERGFATTGGDVTMQTPDDIGIPVLFGSSNVNAAADTRYLAPGYASAAAGTAPLEMVMPRTGTFGRISARHNAAVGNGSSVEYILRVNDTDTALRVTVATGGLNTASFDGEQVTVALGDRVSLKAVKAAGIGNGAVEAMVTLLMYPPTIAMFAQGDPGPQGPPGPPGPPGSGAADGAFGMAYDFEWENTNTSVNPGFGKVRVNTTSFSLATEMAISFAEKGIFVADLWLGQIAANDVILLMDPSGTKRFLMARASGPSVLQPGGQWYKIPLAQVQAGGQWNASVVYEVRVGRI